MNDDKRKFWEQAYCAVVQSPALPLAAVSINQEGLSIVAVAARHADAALKEWEKRWAQPNAEAHVK